MNNQKNNNYKSGAPKRIFRKNRTENNGREILLNQAAKELESVKAMKASGEVQTVKSLPNQNRNKKASGYENRPRKNNGVQNRKREPQRRTPVRIIPLGGLNEIGKNFTVIECANDMIIIDCGLAFPDSEMFGVDIVIPDFTYVEKNIDKLRGIVLTHGHEDHIGGLPYFLRKFNVPVYGTRLTLGLVEGKLKEHGLLSGAKLNVVTPRQSVKFGCFLSV